MSAGTLFIVSAPSGAGKTSLVGELIGSMEDVVVSISHTTRGSREGENEGVDYHFIDEQTFEAMISQGVFLEHARVFDHRYGTSRDWVEEQLRQHRDVILEIDWQGARQVRAQITDSVAIFILPPSRAELQSRLEKRALDDPTVIARRMTEAVGEMSHHAEYDYLVVNDDFRRALSNLQAIVRATRQATRVQQAKLGAVIDDLLAS